jgi:hypothetical protein
MYSFVRLGESSSLAATERELESTASVQQMNSSSCLSHMNSCIHNWTRLKNTVEHHWL